MMAMVPAHAGCDNFDEVLSVAVWSEALVAAGYIDGAPSQHGMAAISRAAELAGGQHPATQAGASIAATTRTVATAVSSLVAVRIVWGRVDTLISTPRPM
jgi:hypothetical protein